MWILVVPKDVSFLLFHSAFFNHGNMYQSCAGPLTENNVAPKEPSSLSNRVRNLDTFRNLHNLVFSIAVADLTN